MKKLFIAPIIVSLLALALVYWWGGMTAFLLAAALAVLEVTLSFDNAIVNAKVLAQMPPHWQKRFLTWGMLISVVGVTELTRTSHTFAASTYRPFEVYITAALIYLAMNLGLAALGALLERRLAAAG